MESNRLLLEYTQYTPLGRAYNEIVALHSTMYHRPLASKRIMIPGLLFFLSSMVNPISPYRYRDDGGGCMAAAD